MRRSLQVGRVLRITVGGAAVLGAIGLSFPLLPWVSSGAVRRWTDATLVDSGLAGPVVPHLVVSALLGLAALCWPRVAWRPARQVNVAVLACIAAGAVLLLEPLISLALQGVAALQPQPVYVGLLLPSYRLGIGFDLAGLLALVTWVVVPAVVEEFLFRARLLPWLVERLGRLSALSLTTILFALAHGTVPQMVVCLPIGLLLGLIRLASPNWYPCVLAHGLHNLLFLLVGGAVTASPTLSLVLLAGGGWLLAYAWALGLRPTHLPHSNRRLVLAGALVLASVLAIWPLWRVAADRLWVAAVVAVAADTRVDRVALVQRLERVVERGQLGERRRAGLFAAATALPPPGRRWVRAVIDPAGSVAALPPEETALAVYDRSGYRFLADCFACPLDLPAIGRAARRLGRERPVAMATFLRDHPFALSAWYGSDRTAVLVVLEPLGGRDRSALLGLLFREWGADPAMAVLLNLPPAAVGPLDRRAFRRYHPDPDGWLQGRPDQDPDRLAAWR